MKKLIFVIVSILLIISILINVGLFYALRFEWDWDKETLQQKTILIHYLDNSELLEELNFRHLNELGNKPENLEKIDSLRFTTINALNNIRNELIDFTGGLNENGQYMNPKSKYRINYFFYEENYMRPFTYEFFDNMLLTYSEKFENLTGIESNLNGVTKILGYYNRTLPSEVFYDMTLSESMITIDLIKTKIELDFYEFLTENKKEE